MTLQALRQGLIFSWIGSLFLIKAELIMAFTGRASKRNPQNNDKRLNVQDRALGVPLGQERPDGIYYLPEGILCGNDTLKAE